MRIQEEALDEAPAQALLGGGQRRRVAIGLHGLAPAFFGGRRALGLTGEDLPVTVEALLLELGRLGAGAVMAAVTLELGDERSAALGIGRGGVGRYGGAA